MTGAAGLPELTSAGNTLRPYTELKLSLRLPPTTDPQQAAAALKDALESDAPYQAEVEFVLEQTISGWDAPPLQDWLTRSMREASLNRF